MNGELEGEEGGGRLEEVERGLRGTLERLDRALHLCEQVQAGQQTLFARLARLEAQLESLEGEDLAGLEDRVGDRLERSTERLEHRLGALERRLEQLGAQLEAVDASFVRHQGQNEEDLRRAGEAVDRVQQVLDQHEDAHVDGRWRSGR